MKPYTCKKCGQLIVEEYISCEIDGIDVSSYEEKGHNENCENKN